jgi:hypothetical protein
MRQDVDRRGGEIFEVVGAAGERAIDVARLIGVQEMQDALSALCLGHFLFRSCQRLLHS